MRLFIAFVAFIIVASILEVTAVWGENKHFISDGPGVMETTIIVRPGSSTAVIAKQLYDAHMIDSPYLFRLGVTRRQQQAKLKAGEYDFPAHVSMFNAMEMMVKHAIVIHRVTIPEGLTSAMAVALVKADPVLEGDVPEIPEGSLLPDTYLYERGTTRAELLARMHAAQDMLMAKLWPARKDGLPFQTQEQAIILASMVEKETSRPDERPRIAAVFINRLKSGMKLESDPTIIYGLTKGVPLGHPLRQSELATPNPYSTYQIAGLPPTPISNPGKDSIASVLNPADSNELYFVADGTGGHAFAVTSEEHQKNVANLRKIERDRAQSPTPATPATPPVPAIPALR